MNYILTKPYYFYPHIKSQSNLIEKIITLILGSNALGSSLIIYKSNFILSSKLNKL